MLRTDYRTIGDQRRYKGSFDYIFPAGEMDTKIDKVKNKKVLKMTRLANCYLKMSRDQDRSLYLNYRR